MKISIAFLFMLIATNLCCAQIDSNAVKNADAYLAAVKIAEIPEGVQAAKQAAWRIDKLPVLQDYTTLYEGMFDTDVSNIKGYKRLVQAKIQSEAGNLLETKYILISYQDKKSGNWLVYEFRELKGTSVEYELGAAKRDLGETNEYIKDQFNYRRYAYWLILDGKLQEARQASEKAIAINHAQPDKNFDDECSENIRIIKAIIGADSDLHP